MQFKAVLWSAWGGDNHTAPAAPNSPPRPMLSQADVYRVAFQKRTHLDISVTCVLSTRAHTHTLSLLIGVTALQADAMSAMTHPHTHALGTGLTDACSNPPTLARRCMQVAKHTTKSDCWVAIDGKVYDVTEVSLAHAIMEVSH
jgi:hypothetical protein